MIAGAGRSIGRLLLEAIGILPVEWTRKGIDHSPQELVAYRYVHDPPRSLDLIAPSMPVISQQHNADFVFIHIECDAQQSAGKSYQLLETNAGKP